MAIKARALRELLKEVMAARVDLYEGSPLETLRGFGAWAAVAPPEEAQALEALRALRSLATEQAPSSTAQAVATAKSLHGMPSINGTLSRILESCQSSLLTLSLTYSKDLMDRIAEVASRGCAITLVGNENDDRFRHMVAFWPFPANKPLALVAADLELMHIKAIVADRKRGYLGSGNLTRGGVKNNMELGITFDGELGEQIWRFLESQRRSGHLVEYQRR